MVDSKGPYLDCASSEAVWTVGVLLVRKAEPKGEGGKGDEGLQVGRKGPQETKPAARRASSACGKNSSSRAGSCGSAADLLCKCGPLKDLAVQIQTLLSLHFLICKVAITLCQPHRFLVKTERKVLEEGAFVGFWPPSTLPTFLG